MSEVCRRYYRNRTKWKCEMKSTFNNTLRLTLSQNDSMIMSRRRPVYTFKNKPEEDSPT